jgi:hypothetical protein
MTRRLPVSFVFALVVSACSKSPPPAPAPAAQPAPAPHMDHDPRHGGILSMSGDQHIETVVRPDGRVLLYVSDARRNEANPTDVTGTVTRRVEGRPAQTFTVRADRAAGAVVVDAPPPENPATDYEFQLQWRSTPVEGGVQVPSGGTAAALAAAQGSAGHAHGAGEHGHGAGEHAHGSPHGGVVQSVPWGHVETKLDRDGRVAVWLLDEREQTLPAQGATATIRLATPGATDVALAFDAAQNALVGQVPAPTSEHPVALVTVTRSGSAPASLRVAFHLEPGGH